MLRLALAAAVLASPSLARDPRFALPLDCTPGTDCRIAAYPDRDPGPGKVDFTCGPLTEDGLAGTDLAMDEGLADVLSAAPGRITQVGGGCVLLDHGGGWLTRYCGLSHTYVAPGRRVPMGEVIGRATELRFTLTRDDRPVDPFDAANDQSCGGTPEPLWLDPPAYMPDNGG